MSLYIKLLTDYYHLLVGDLEEERKSFLKNLLYYFLEKDEYGYDPTFSGENARVLYLLQAIERQDSPMSIESYLQLEKWHREDAWSNGELQEYFLHKRKEKEIKVIYDFDHASSEEIDILKELLHFLERKQRSLKFLNIHNARYVDAKDLIREFTMK